MSQAALVKALASGGYCAVAVEEIPKLLPPNEGRDAEKNGRNKRRGKGGGGVARRRR